MLWKQDYLIRFLQSGYLDHGSVAGQGVSSYRDYAPPGCDTQQYLKLYPPLSMKSVSVPQERVLRQEGAVWRFLYCGKYFEIWLSNE